METSDKLSNPYNKIDVSLLIPSISFDMFQNLHHLLIPGSYGNKVEMLIKVDGINDIDKFHNLCNSSPFLYKILIYQKHYSRHSLHHFFNDLAAISSGKIIWLLNDDISSIRGNWQNVLMSTRNKFIDNIYCVIVPLDNGKGTSQIVATPAVSREWYEKFGYIALMPNYDRWLCEMSSSLHRQVVIKDTDMGISMPQGRRVLSKQERKEIFYPKFEKVLRKIKCSIN